MDIDTSARNVSTSSSRLFESYDENTIINGVADIVKAINDKGVTDTFNDIQEGRASRINLKRLLNLMQGDEDQTMRRTNVLVQYFRWNWNRLTSETEILDALSDEVSTILVAYLVAKLATVRLAHHSVNVQDAHVKAIFRHVATNHSDWSKKVNQAENGEWKPFDDQVQKLIATVVDERIPPYFSDSMRYNYKSTAVNVVQLLEDACCSYALVPTQFPSDQDRKREFYSRYFAIVQSSGVGKSRSVVELMKHSQRVFVVNVNLRKANNAGEPSRTPVIADLIDKDVNSTTDWHILIVAVQLALKDLVDANRLPNDADTRMAFHLQQQDATQQTFWSNVASHFTTMRRDVAGRGAVANEWDGHVTGIYDKNHFDVVNANGEKMVLVLALDECLESLQIKAKDNEKFLQLQRALDYTKLTLTDVVAILIDTNSSVIQCAPPDWRHGSSRVIGGARLNTPFFYFPIDLSRQLRQRIGPDTSPPEAEYRTSVKLPEPSSLSSSSSSTNTAAAAAVVVRYNPIEEVLCSRPLFATYLCNKIDKVSTTGGGSERTSVSADTVEAIFQTCMEMVASKLKAKSTDALSEQIHYFSYAAIRWHAMTYSRVMIESLVGQQLGLIREVGPRMETIWCAYGLEPILGRHAASEMVTSAIVFEHTLRTLHDLQAQGQLHGYEGRGDHDELVATIVLTRAHDQAFSRVLPATPTPMQKYGPVLLRDWLVQLLDDDADDDASLWAKLQQQAGSALDRAVVYFHSVHRVESDSKPAITVEMARWHLQRGTAMVTPRGLAATDLFVPFAVPVSASLAVDLMDPDTYVLGLMPVQVKNVVTDVDNEELLRDLLFSDVVQQFENAPRVGLVMQMNPNVGQGGTESKDVFVVANTKKSPRLVGTAPEPRAFVPCGFIKYFRNRIPCIQQGPNQGEVALRLLRSMMQFVPFAHLTTQTLQQYYRAGTGYTRTEEQLQPIVQSIGEEMFHINRPYGGGLVTRQTTTAKSAAVAVNTKRPSKPSVTEDSKADADDTTVKVVYGAARSGKRSAAEPQHAVKRTKEE